MLKLYYTGAGAFNEKQEDPSQSLGGNISSSIVPNDFLNNIFGEASFLSRANNRDETIALALKNEFSQDIAIIEVWAEWENPNNRTSVIKLGAIEVDSDGCGGFTVQNIPSKYSKPYGVNLYDIRGESNKVNIGGLAVDEYVGLYFNRTYLTSATEVQKDADTLEKEFDGDITVEKVENITLIFEYKFGSPLEIGSESISGSTS